MLQYLILNNRLEAACKYGEQSQRSYKEEMLGHFSKGRRLEFMRLFLLMRREDKLEFYLRVYFLVYNIHPALNNKPAIPEQELIAFKQYLDTHGADLAKTNQFLQFYALPFVKKPLEHASFKTLFKKEWVHNLTQKLNIFLQDEDRRMREEAKTFGANTKKDINQQNMRVSEPSETALKVMEEKNRKLFDEVQQLRTKYASLESSNQALVQSFNSHLMESQAKWFQITRELTSNARTLIELILKANCGLTQDRKFQRVKKRTEKFEKVVKRELQELMSQEDLSVFDKPSINEISCSVSATPTISQRNITTYLSIEQFVPTNYPLLLRDFKKMPEEQRIQILEGFSWRIIKSKNKWVRRQTIVGLIVNDFLGLMSGDIQGLLLSKALLYHVIKLLLYISEDSYGSKVLFRNGGLYKQIVELLPEVHQANNYVCLAVLLEILQNIWHNREILLELIHLNVIDLCVNQLLEDRALVSNEDILESIVTLLLNATSLEEGLDAYEEQINIFFTLSEAFKVTNDSNRNLIGAIIYALLGRKTMWKLAQEAKLPNFIDDLIEMDGRSNKQQLRLIQQKLTTFQQGKTMKTGDYSDEEIDSNLEDQIFQRNEEELTYLEGYIKGHEILSTKYSLKNREAENQIVEINKIMDQFTGYRNSSHPKSTTPPDSIRKFVAKEGKFTEKTRDNRRNRSKEGRKDSAREAVRVKSREAEREGTAGVGKDEKLPEIRHKKGRVHTSKERSSQDKLKTPEDQDYHYKSPNFKYYEDNNVRSMEENPRQSDKQRVDSFELQRQSLKQFKNKIIEEEDKRKGDKQSAQKPEYRIKKSSSVQKNIGGSNRRQEQNYESSKNYESNKNSINLPEFKVEGVRSPVGPKRSREEVLRQLNQQLKQQRKLSGKSFPVNGPVAHRQNAMIVKKNVSPISDPDGEAFAAKPKLRRTPPKEEP